MRGKQSVLPLLIIDKCKTKSGPDPNKECFLPFTFFEFGVGKKTYNTCALDATGTPWCPTELPAMGSLEFYLEKGAKCPWKSWGYCNKDCPIEDPPGGNFIECFDITESKKYVFH